MKTADNKSNGQGSFVFRFFQTESIGLGLGVPAAAAYVLLLLDLSPLQVQKTIQFLIIVALVVVGGIAMPVNYMLVKPITPLLKELKKGEMSSSRGQKLYLLLMNLPLKHAVMLFVRIAGGSVVVTLYMLIFLKVELIKVVMAITLSAYGAYLAAITVYMAAAALVRQPGQTIVSRDLLPEKFIEKRKIFGLGVIKRNLLFLIVPIVLTNLTIFFTFYSAHISGVAMDQLVGRVAGVLVVNTITLLIAIALAIFMMYRPIKILVASLGKFLHAGRGETDPIPTDLSDDFAYISHLMNKAIESLHQIIIKVEDATLVLTDSVQELSASSAQISTTSNEQAAAVKEIVTTMEDADQLARMIAASIHEVTGTVRSTTSAVESGKQRIAMSLSKMDEISESNGKTIAEIRSLGEKIDSIWDIVNIINGIANQTKIIAFNAELEASAAGDAGKNFQIVATEIRRLADSTVSSTSEIRKKIQEIQQSSDEVISASEDGTRKINHGRDLSSALNDDFSEIKSLADISACSADEIESSVNQQVLSFEQILATLRQIADGIEYFAESTKSTSTSSEQLRQMADSLSQLVKGGE